jgi:beta-aspartyl-dipeptidase (metallo-type)
LIRGARLFSPDELGVRDVLIDDSGHIAAIEPSISPTDENSTLDAAGKLLLPGFIDNHLHTIGGGGEQGPTSRPGCLYAPTLIASGITCAVGCLGFDGTSRALEDLYLHTLALRQTGLGAFMLTGAFDVPTPTLTGSVRRDLFLVEPVIGVGEIAIADHRSSLPSAQEIGRLAAEAIGGGRLVGKCGYLNLHIGEVPGGLAMVAELLRVYGQPPDRFLPTHVNRSGAVLEEAISFGRLGGYLDLTAGITPAEGYAQALALSEAVGLLTEAGIAANRIMVSSDAGGMSTGAQIAPTSLLREFRALANRFGVGRAAGFFTANVADALGFVDRGRIAVAARADLLLLDQDLTLAGVLLGGTLWQPDPERGAWAPSRG